MVMISASFLKIKQRDDRLGTISEIGRDGIGGIDLVALLNSDNSNRTSQSPTIPSHIASAAATGMVRLSSITYPRIETR